MKRTTHTRRQRRAALAGTLLVGGAALGLLAACGGGSDEDVATETSSATLDLALSDQERSQLAALGVPADEARYIITLNSAAVEATMRRSTSILSAGNGQAEGAATSRRHAAVGTLGASLLAAHGASVRQRYSQVMDGLSISVSKARADSMIEALRHDPAVERIEVERPVSAMGAVSHGASATWGLDRIDQKKLPLNQQYAAPYSGAGVTAYVLDTGISAHEQLGSRLATGQDWVGDGNGTTDCNGHGTHVAGTIAGSTVGVAPDATVVPMRVLGCSGGGTSTAILSAMEWIYAHGQRPSVINMSLGSSAYASMDEAVARLTTAGYSVVVAAGNDNRNACGYSPARAPSAITVGATDNRDVRASYSNFGSCLDFFAPGSSIQSASNTSSTELTYKSGTSMASPHVAGVVAQLLEARPTLTPSQVSTQLIKQAATGVVKTTGSGSPNRLLYAGTATAVTFAAAQEARVSTLTATTKAAKSTWTATVTVKVLNASGVPIKGALVSGQFSNKSTTLTCTTAAAGTCAMTSAALSNTSASTVTFAVKAMSGGAITYRSDNNVVSSLLVAKP